MSAGVVIVGAGQAGFETAAALRRLRYDGRIVLLSSESEAPYARPPLSKELLHGVEATVTLRPPAFYDQQGIELRSGARVALLDRPGQEVVLASGERLAYERLVLATGARNRPLPVPGADLDGVVGVRTHAEARTLAAGLRPGVRVAVIGGGFIGLEVAAAARARGAEVTIVEAAARCMQRALSAPTAAHLESLHRGAGAVLRTGVGVRFIGDDGHGHAAGVVLADGTRSAADLVVVGIGVVPETDLAATSGLAVDDGILVDATLRTADPAVFAIGDCARFLTAGDGGTHRLESVQNATDQARCVAATIADGVPQPFVAVPWFWSNQHGARLQIAGVADDAATAVVRGDPATGAFSVFRFSRSRLAAVESVNRPRDHMAARRLLASGTPVSPDDVSSDAVDLRAMAVVT